jgi:hypothetical protein
MPHGGQTANLAAGAGDLPSLEWLAKQDPPILPETWGANRAAGNGHLLVLEWMAKQDPPILPATKGAAPKEGL